MSRQDEEVTRPGSGHVPKPNPLTSKLLLVRGCDSFMTRWSDSEHGDREPIRPVVVREPGFGLWRARHVDGDYDRPLQALRGMNGDERD